MLPREFVELAKVERDSLLEMYFDGSLGTEAAAKIDAIHLHADQSAKLRDAIGTILTDVFYHWLLVLDGCASLGGQQHGFTLRDEHGNEFAGSGQIESDAWIVFHGTNPPASRDHPADD